MPSWWVNGKNWGALEYTSNHSSNLYYVLDPAHILSDTPIVTPDGNTIHRIEVALDPKDSVYQAARGSYNNAYGVRDRVTVGAGTTVLYATVRQDGVSNPDQVAGAPDAFAADFSGVGEWQRDTLSYSNAYPTRTWAATTSTLRRDGRPSTRCRLTSGASAAAIRNARRRTRRHCCL